MTLYEGGCTRSNLDLKLDRLLGATQEVGREYGGIQEGRSRHSAFLYFCYLRWVHRERELRKVVELDWECERGEGVVGVGGGYGEGFFVCVDMAGEVRAVGENVLGLLGWRAEGLVGGNIRRILP